MIKYENIVKYIKNEILSGNIKAGNKLPSIRELCFKFSCSKITATKALAALEKEHIVYSVPRSGYFLVENKIYGKDSSTKLIDFASPYPDRFALPYDEFQHCLIQAMELYKENLFANFSTKGLPALITAMAKKFQDYEVFAAEEQIFVTTGSQQAISIISRMPFPNNKNNILIEQPTYHGAMECFKLNSSIVYGIKRGVRGIDFEELENIFKNNEIKFFYTIPRFHNPTGFSYSNAEKRNILKLAEKYDVYIIEDDYLNDLEHFTKSQCMYCLDLGERVIYLKSFSKILLPGLRIAAVVLPTQLVNKFSQYKKWDDISTPIISQGALEMYIKSGMFDVHAKKLRNVYSQKMTHLKDLIKQHNCSNIVSYVPDSGFFASIEIINGISSNHVISRLKEKGILVSDTKRYYLGDFFDERFLRLSLSRVDNNQITQGILEILKEINEYNGKIGCLFGSKWK
ncbi:MAG: PLP-dependent aminotransferase family protein [Bacillota bacterium]|nr:PLP-dependent aminotransferase family protein [Bacillota bacterium]